MRIIAEISNCHEGDFEYAKALVRKLSKIDCYAIKLQLFTADEIYSKGHPSYEEFQRLSLGGDSYQKLALMIKESGKKLFCDVFGFDSLDWAKDFRADAVKIHSSDILNAQLVRAVAEAFQTVFISCAGARLPEIASVVKLIRQCQSLPILVSGTQGFPTKIEDCQLNRIRHLKQVFGLEIVCAEHAAGGSNAAWDLPFVAMGLGADYLEKHVTIDRTRGMDDDVSALNVEEFTKLVERLQSAETALGSNFKYLFHAADESYRKKMIKTATSSRSVDPGKNITLESMRLVRGKSQSSPRPIEDFIDRAATKSLEKDEPLNGANTSQSVVILVAARMSSSRLPQKSLCRIGNKPSLSILLERLVESKTCGVILATGKDSANQPFVDLASSLGIGAYCGDDEDILKRFLGAAHASQADHIVRCTGDNLFVDSELIDKVVESHLLANADYTYLVGVPDGADFEVISTKSLKVLADISCDTSRSEYLSWFLNRQELFNIQPYIVDGPDLSAHRLTLDYEQDYKNISEIFENLGFRHKYSDLVKTLENRDPIGVEIGKQASQRTAEVRKNINLGYDFRKYIEAEI